MRGELARLTARLNTVYASAHSPCDWPDFVLARTPGCGQLIALHAPGEFLFWQVLRGILKADGPPNALVLAVGRSALKEQTATELLEMLKLDGSSLSQATIAVRRPCGFGTLVSHCGGCVIKFGPDGWRVRCIRCCYDLRSSCNRQAVRV